MNRVDPTDSYLLGASDGRATDNTRKQLYRVMDQRDRYRAALERIVEMATRSDAHPDVQFGDIARAALQQSSAGEGEK